MHSTATLTLRRTSSKYILRFLKDDLYTFNCIRIEGTQVSTFSYLRSETPIIDYSICIINDVVHVCYVLENAGEYRLYYLNTASSQISLLSSSRTPMSPVIFYYYQGLWINTLINGQLHLLLSMDLGNRFSIPAPCSLQSHLQRATFVSTPLKYLTAHELYITLDYGLKLCTLSTIDFEGFHGHSNIPTELDLLLQGLSIHSCNKEDCEIAVETSHLKQELDLLKKQLNTVPPKPQSNISSATTAFMEELTGWDLPPRL